MTGPRPGPSSRAPLEPLPSTVVGGPVRTCVGCRGTGTRSALLRVVVADGLDLPGGRAAVPDPRRRAPGRGASLHLDPVCLDLAERRRALERALRVEGPLDTTALRAYVEDQASTPGGVTGTTAPSTQRSGFPRDEHPMSSSR